MTDLSSLRRSAFQSEGQIRAQLTRTWCTNWGRSSRRIDFPPCCRFVRYPEYLSGLTRESCIHRVASPKDPKHFNPDILDMRWVAWSVDVTDRELNPCGAATRTGTCVQQADQFNQPCGPKIPSLTIMSSGDLNSAFAISSAACRVLWPTEEI